MSQSPGGLNNVMLDSWPWAQPPELRGLRVQSDGPDGIPPLGSELCTGTSLSRN
jgi:hypothetical protein